VTRNLSALLVLRQAANETPTAPALAGGSAAWEVGEEGAWVRGGVLAKGGGGCIGEGWCEDRWWGGGKVRWGRGDVDRVRR